MAGVRVVMAPDWREQLSAAEAAMFQEQLGPLMLATVQNGTAVLTSRLRDSEDFQVVDDGELPELQVGVFPDDDGEVEYWAAVEFGFHGEEWVRTYLNRDFFGSGHAALIRAHSRMGNSPEQPYLRPALYREYAP